MSGSPSTRISFIFTHFSYWAVNSDRLLTWRATKRHGFTFRSFALSTWRHFIWSVAITDIPLMPSSEPVLMRICSPSLVDVIWESGFLENHGAAYPDGLSQFFFNLSMGTFLGAGVNRWMYRWIVLWKWQRKHHIEVSYSTRVHSQKCYLSWLPAFTFPFKLCNWSDCRNLFTHVWTV